MGAILLKNIIFIGMPGAGKTTFGKYFAKKHKMPFLDTDILIEEKEHKKIPEIFSESGESYFRSLEEEVISHVSEMKNVVISIGGGAWNFLKNRERLKKNSYTVYLKCELEELYNRLQNSSQERPLLKKGFISLQEIYEKRKEKYEEADIIIDTTKKSFPEIYSDLEEKLDLKEEKNNLDTKISQYEVKTSENKYPIFVGKNITHEIANFFLEKYCHKKSLKPRIFLIADPYTKLLYGEKIVEVLKEKGFSIISFTIPDGEKNKNLDWVQKAYTSLIKNDFDRGDIIVALGGGVIGDIAGFVAATYMRGLPVIQIPTTLLAQVDASIGGKTAVNLPEGKNLVGAFHQPDAVFIDLNYLKNLSPYQYRQGLAECVKYGIIGSKSLFSFMENNIEKILERDLDTLEKIVSECAHMKAKIVEKDAKEKGIRAFLNLGHTIGHALEAFIGYGKLGHGDAVSLGIISEGYLSKSLGLLSNKSLLRIENLLKNLGFPRKINFTFEEVLYFLKNDKKKNRGEIVFALPLEIGKVDLIKDIDEEKIKEACEYIWEKEKC